ncbi:MAG: hypothetical protein R3F61_05240 [Myxococcota bacterium]
MSTAEWVEEREERRAFALSSPPAHAAFRSWSFAAHPALLAVAARALDAASPAPSGPALALALAPTPAGLPDTRATRRTHERGLVDSRALAPLDDTPANGRAWQVAELDRLGREVEDRERRSWRRSWPQDPARDAGAAEVWAALFSGNPWGLRERCEALWLGPAMRSFAGVLTARELPMDVRASVLDDLREAFFYRLLGDRTSTPGWLEIAARVVETVEPVIGPAHTLSSTGRAAAAGCVTSRAGWGATTAAVFADLPDREGRAGALAGLFEDPAVLEALLDLHTVLRLLDVQPDDRAAMWRVVTQNRGKARGRLRALVSREASWLPVLLALDGLQARTEVAVARFAWSWAWQEMSRGFSFDAGRPTTPPCEDVPDTLAPLADDLSAMRTWVLLVVLKGRYAHLERWVRTGGTGDRDSTWARLLKDLPPHYLDPDGGYKRVRIHLHEGLVGHADSLRVLLADIADLSIDRQLKDRMLALIEPVWSREIPQPRSGFPTFVENARDAARLFEEDPCL